MDHNRKIKIYKDLQLVHVVLQGLSVLKKLHTIINTKKPRSCSVRRVNRDRKKKGFYAVTFKKVKELDGNEFFTYTRMDRNLFNELLDLIRPHLVKTSIREPIDPECRLAVMLLYLSQGSSVLSLAELFKLGKETVRQIILETSVVLSNALYPTYVNEPNFKDYNTICNDFWTLCKMPNCIGSIDGKHIAIRCPGSQFESYKNHSVVLMAVSDANFRFTHVDVGTYDNEMELGIFQRSRFGKRLLENKLPIPKPDNLPNCTKQVPCYFIADCAFPLLDNLMQPYSGTELSPKEQHFNNTLSRARRTVENSLGILVSRWRILLTTLNMLPDNAEKIVLATVALHNFIMFNEHNASLYCPSDNADWEDCDGQLHDGRWRSEVAKNLPSMSSSSNTHPRSSKTSVAVRNRIRDFLYCNQNNAN